MNPELEDIIKGCKSGKIKSQEKLYNLFSDELFGLCLYYSKDYTEAEDILHDGFIKIFNSIETFRYQGSFEGWMKRIMVNTALEKFRREKHLHPVSDVSYNEKERYAEDLISQISAKDLLKLVQNLSPKYRMVFNLYVIEGYSHKEISEMLGISIGTSKSNLARARAILQKNVSVHFFNDTKQIKY